MAVATAVLVMAAPAGAQTKLKWAHVYEISEPYHTEALWAPEEIKKRSNGRYEIGYSRLPNLVTKIRSTRGWA
jgi:TRAP-type C4-dicarboxylate transport system substrate-binding protein